MNINEANSEVIEKTKAWIQKVVIGFNFCPFAAKEFKKGSICYTVVDSPDPEIIINSLSEEFERLDNDSTVETSFIILKDHFNDFYDYLDLIDLCQFNLKQQDKEGIYQLASFHPLYLFEGTLPDDPANYTNRSIYPMIHILKEASITLALENFPDPESIPDRNIQFARNKGIDFMREQRNSCR